MNPSRYGRGKMGFSPSSNLPPLGNGMRLIVCMLGPALIQALIAFLVVRGSGGMQTWTGELAFGLAVFGIPATLVANHRLLTVDLERPRLESLWLCAVSSAILPVVLAGIYLVFMFLQLRA